MKPYLIGIVGHGADKFTPQSEIIAKDMIREIIGTAILEHDKIVVVSGHSPMGGIDIWAEEIAVEMRVDIDIKCPKQLSWYGVYGYRARNLDIAKSDEVHVILVDKYPPGYAGMRFETCYHCDKHLGKVPDHVKSGGCWTAWKSRHPIFHVVPNTIA